MNILLQSKQNVEKFFAKQAVFANNILDMVNEGEKAWGFHSGGIGTGFNITIGFFDDKARYVGFKKNGPGYFAEADLRAVLSQFGPYTNWTISPGSEYLDYVEKEGDKIVATATGWYAAKGIVAFVYLPHVDGQVPIIPDRVAVDAKLVNS